MDWFKLAYTLLGGLGIFFFGMKTLSESLQAMGSGMIRKVISTLTTNRFSGVIVGLLVTCFVQSSSITTVMVVGFVNAGLMNLAQAIGVVFGANIGTTITGWVISIKVGKYSLLLVGLGVIPMMMSKKERIAEMGRVIFAIGLIFLGLNFMSGAFKPLRSNEDFIQLMTYFAEDNYFSLWATILTGCLLTFLIQSSSAMLGITIALASSGSITFQTALALVMGENIGTTITAILAGFAGNTAGKRAGAAHAIFNVLGVLVLSTFFWAYKDFVEGIVSGQADLVDESGQKPLIAAHIAAGHTFFNVVNVILFLPFLKPLEKLVVWLIPEKEWKEKKKLEFFGPTAALSPSIAIAQANAVLVKMADMTEIAFKETIEFLNAKQAIPEKAKHVGKYEDIADRIQMEMAVFLGHVMTLRLTEEETAQVKSLLRMSDELESISDYCSSIIRYAQRSYDEQFVFDEKTKVEVADYSDRIFKFFDIVVRPVKLSHPLDSDKIASMKRDLSDMADTLKNHHLDRASTGDIPPVASLTLSDIIVSLRRIKNHTVNLAEAHARGSSTL